MAKHAAVLVIVAMICCASSAWAQQAAASPEPGPEHKRLAAFVGTWKDEGEMKPDPFVPGGKYTSTETCEWFDGGFSIVCRAEFSGVGIGKAKAKGLSILGYNREEKVYFYYGITSLGETLSAKGNVERSLWTWNGESMMGGKHIKGRFTFKQLSPNSASMKYETSTEGGPWTLMVEAKRSRGK